VTQGSLHEEAVYWTAETYFKAKDFPSALKYYSEIIEKYPTSRFYVFARYSKAWSLYELGDYEAAIQEFQALRAIFRRILWPPSRAIKSANASMSSKNTTQPRRRF